MSHTVDVFWSFRSPYSYLVTPDLLKLRRDFDLRVTLRPVLPIAVRSQALVFDASDKKRPRYIVMDSRRRAAFLGLPFKWPRPDPVVQDLETYEVPEDQPRIWRLTALGLAGEARGKGIDLAHAIAALIWSGIEDWDQGDHLKDAAASVGLDLEEMESAVDMEAVRREVEANHEALEAAGHWGVPTMVFDGESFFGQDRIETLRWRLETSGVAMR